MTLNQDDRELVEACRRYLEDSISHDERYGQAERNDREDGSTLATRFVMGPSCWFEIAFRPLVPQVRVGFLTDDPCKSEECEQAIQDSGETMSQFVGLAFGDAGLDWQEPPVEQYHEEGKYFYFATPLEVEDLVDLENGEVRNKVLRMLDGYLLAFGPAIAVEESVEEEE